MKCQERENLFLFLNQMLGPDEAERVRRHLADCAECAQVAEEYRKLDSALDDWVAADPSPWFDARLRARVEASVQKKSWPFGFGLARALAAGVAVIVLIVVAVVVFSHQEVVEINHPTSNLQQPVAITAGPRVPAKAEGVRWSGRIGR